MKETERIKNLCETALFIAIVFLGVFIIKFPGPFGYMHIGDSMIFLSVLMLGGKRGAVAGGIGAALADIVSGYTIWAVPTLICKAAMALVMGAMIKHHAFGLNGRVLWIISAVAGGLTQGVGYVIFWYFLFGKAAAIAAVPGLAFQAVSGIIIAFVIAMIMNVGSYWYSDKIVLSMYQARELSEDEAPMLHRMVAELSANAGIPKPRVCVIPEDAPNAFATGRDPEHGVVAVTDGIMRILSPEELRGVIAHEIGHIANRDILIQTIAGVLASVIVSIANFMQFAAIFGGSSNDEEGGTNPIAAFLLAILAPIAASIIQMAISRSREYLADETGARICGQPLALAGALHKLGVASGQIPMQNGNPSTEQMFIVSPLFGFGGGSMANLFSTHPPLEERIARLQEMSRQAR